MVAADVLVPGAKVCFSGTVHSPRHGWLEKEQLHAMAEARGLVAVPTLTKDPDGRAGGGRGRVAVVEGEERGAVGEAGGDGGGVLGVGGGLNPLSFAICRGEGRHVTRATSIPNPLAPEYEHS